MKAVIKTAFLYICYYKKQTLSILLSVIFSMALMSGVGSLVYSGSRGQLENARKVSGDWHYFIPADDQLVKKIGNHMSGDGYQLDKTGVMEKKRVLEEPYVISMLYGDENYLQMRGLTFLEGTYPAGIEEIAVDEYTLSNLLPGGKTGDTIVLDGSNYRISGILSKSSVMEETEMQVYVSREMKGDRNQQRLYLKFSENKAMVSQILSLQKAVGFDKEHIYNNWDVVSYLGGAQLSSVAGIIRSGLALPQGKAGFIFGQLNESFHLTQNAVRIVLAAFSGFIIYSIFSISIWKRISQYGIFRVIGIEDKSVFGMLLSELWFLFVVGFPFGVWVGNAAAKICYSRFSRIFTGDISGEGRFYIDKSTIWFGFCFLLVFLAAVSFKLVRKIRKMTVIQMLHKESGRERVSRRIFSTRTVRMTSVLTRKFMFHKKGTFVGILISLSLGGLVFLAANYVIVNTERNNELTMKADDGLGSDMQIYMESAELSQVIPEETARQIRESGDFSEVYGISYLLGEVPFMNGEWTWETYYAETAVKKEPERANEIDPGIMKAYNGRITDEGNGNYKMKANVYGYDEGMLSALKEYILEGEIYPEDMKKENTVVLQTLMDGQGNYSGLDVKVGDIITLKVPKSQDVAAEVLRFQSPDDQYIEKEFEVSAVVSRTLGKNDFFIGGGNSCLGVVMTNDQMRQNFGVKGYTGFSLQLKDRTKNQAAGQRVKEMTGKIDRCVLRDYTAEIDRQSAFLKQKMFFFYGVAILLLVISMFHIMNSMNFLVLSRRHEFGILRAMGITDAGFMKMMVKEGILYGGCSGIVTLAGFAVVKVVLLYFLQHVYLYVYSAGSVSMDVILLILAVNLTAGVAAVCIPARRVLKENMISEIAA